MISIMVQLMSLPPHHHCSSKIQNGLPFWCRLTQVVLEKKLLNGCSSRPSSSFVALDSAFIPLIIHMLTVCYAAVFMAAI